MTTAMLDQPSPTRLRPSPISQPARGRASARGPVARPERSAPMPSARPGDGVVRACRVSGVRQPAASWRLTDRGIALVLILAAILVLAALTVVGLTAWRVTSPGYQTAGVSELSPR